MELANQVLEKLGIKIKENDKVDEIVDKFFDKQFEIFKQRKEVKELTDDARKNGQIIAFKEIKKALNKKFDLELNVDEPTPVDDIVKELSNKQSSLIEEAKALNKDTDNEKIKKLNADIEEYKQKLADVNSKLIEVKDKSKIEIEEKEKEFNGKLQAIETDKIVLSELSNHKWLLSESDVYDNIKLKLNKINGTLKVDKGKLVVVDSDGASIMNEDQRSIVGFEDLLNQVDNLKIKNNGSGEQRTIVKENMSEAQKNMLAHADTL